MPDNAPPSLTRPVDASSSRGRWGLGIAVVLVIALQIAVPTIAYFLPPPQRLGFQMYAARGGVEVVVIDRDGSSRQFDAKPLVGQFRFEIDWRESLPERVCSIVDDAVEVRITQFGHDRMVDCG